VLATGGHDGVLRTFDLPKAALLKQTNAHVVTMPQQAASPIYACSGRTTTSSSSPRASTGVSSCGTRPAERLCASSRAPRPGADARTQEGRQVPAPAEEGRRSGRAPRSGVLCRTVEGREALGVRVERPDGEAVGRGDRGRWCATSRTRT
jgi:hypothetical protein